MSDQEIEAKFYLSDLPAVQRRLLLLGAQLSQPRLKETNLRLDTPSGDLSAAGRTLRLRQPAPSTCNASRSDWQDDSRAAVLTYKGPQQANAEVAVRQELEVVVSDVEAARRLLEALGYPVMVTYEKWRTVYRLLGVEVSLDELPYGNFVEIEGPDVARIHTAADRLGLNWEKRIPASYLSLFYSLKRKLGLPMPNLTFAAFERRGITAADLGVEPADAA